MRAIKQLRAKLANLLFRNRAEREMNREMNSHLALLEEEFERRGLTPHEAKIAARRIYGSFEQSKELHREERSFLWVEQAVQDLRHAVRGLARSPGFTLLAIFTLALGIGANATLFSAWNAVALKPLPVHEPDQVVRFERWLNSRNLGTMQFAFSWPEFMHCRDHADAFVALTASSWAVPVRGAVPGSLTERLSGELVSANYFSVLGIQPRLGRFFAADEDRARGGNAVAVISHSFWARRFQSDVDVAGRLVRLNGNPVR
jgi:hypothetical protein